MSESSSAIADVVHVFSRFQLSKYGTCGEHIFVGKSFFDNLHSDRHIV